MTCLPGYREGAPEQEQQQQQQEEEEEEDEAGLQTLVSLVA